MGMPVIGLTGRVGVGKSWVLAQWVSQVDIWQVELDLVGHEVLRMEAVIQKIGQRFGDGVLDKDGQVDRKRLGGIVFQDEGARNDLNRIVHPLIRQTVTQMLAGERTRAGVIVGAVIHEIGLAQYCDQMVVVDASDEDIERYAPQRAHIRHAQASRDWYLGQADHRIVNGFDGTVQERVRTLGAVLFKGQ